ncbi:MAG TPA: PEP-utilizing enzyme [Nocardioidaceae bacterium]|nr:PEP-utilizing enzyme [Nocardioidaceae bacterium]
MSAVSGSAEAGFEAPGKGPWELESTHFPRPVTAFVQAAFVEGFVKGFAESTSRYGLLLDHLQPGFARSFMYVQPVAFGAPKGAMGPPPKPVLMLLTRLHPGMRKRIATSARAIENKLWREDLKRWDEVDKPAAIAKHRAIQAVDVTGLSDSDLGQHLIACAQHVADSLYLHHKYTVPSSLPVGDFLAGATTWTGRTSGELLGLLRGSSAISKGFAAVELEDAGKAISSSDSAREILSGPRTGRESLDALAADPGAGPAVSDYLDAVRWRSVGYDVADEAAGEMPDMLVAALRAAVGGLSNPPQEDTWLATIRDHVPEQHRADFDSRLDEVRLIYRLRDERTVYSDGWATGLARRALLEAGRRLVTSGRLHDAQHAVELTADQAAALLAGQPGPSADEVAERDEWRQSHTIADAPPFLRAMPAPPPPVEWLPKRAQRSAHAMNIVLDNLFSVPDTTNTDTVLSGLPVNTGVYEGTARVVNSAAEFERIQPGDILVTRMTSPYFNVVLPLLGAIVTDRGGQLSHAAIVAREYGIPGIVGTREATAKIADGARVRVNGATGEVRLLE